MAKLKNDKKMRELVGTLLVEKIQPDEEGRFIRYTLVGEMTFDGFFLCRCITIFEDNNEETVIYGDRQHYDLLKKLKPENVERAKKVLPLFHLSDEIRDIFNFMGDDQFND